MRITNTVSRAHHPSEGERIDDNGMVGVWKHRGEGRRDGKKRDSLEVGGGQ